MPQNGYFSASSTSNSKFWLSVCPRPRWEAHSTPLDFLAVIVWGEIKRERGEGPMALGRKGNENFKGFL